MSPRRSGTYNTRSNKKYEAERTRYLEAEDLRVIRFENKELYENLEGVLETIKRALQD
jgi:very-short-patch-repair endonuclease